MSAVIFVLLRLAPEISLTSLRNGWIRQSAAKQEIARGARPRPTDPGPVWPMAQGHRPGRAGKSYRYDIPLAGD